MILLTLIILSSSLLSTSIARQSIHEFMEDEEIGTVFKRSAEKMSEVNYQVVSVFHKNENSEKRTRRSVSTIKFEAFDRNYTLYLEENNHVLVGSKTPIFIIKRNLQADNKTDSPFTYEQKQFPLPSNLKLYHDLKNRAAVTMHTDSDGKVQFNGIIGHDMSIHSIPASVNDSISKNRTISSSSNQSNHHIVTKMNSSNFENIYKQVDSKSSNKNQKTKSTVDDHSDKIPDTVYPEILIAVDYGTFETHNNNLTKLAHYILAFWNAVDLRFREMSEPKVRLNIAGLVVPEDNKSAFYMESNIFSDKVLTSATLKEIGKFFSTNSPTNYDVVMGVSARDLIGWDKNKNPSIINGLANLNGSCKFAEKKAAGIYRDNGSFEYVLSAAHELGHLLGAFHDSDTKECKNDTYYIEGGVHATQKRLHWSRCSIQDMKIFLSGNRAGCLRNRPNVGQSYPKILPGKLLSRDKQCQKIFGITFHQLFEDNCKTLYCKSSGKESKIELSLAGPAEGSYCGQGRICLNGDCVSDPKV